MTMRPEYWVLCDTCGHNGDYKFNKRKAIADARIHASGLHHVVCVYRKDLVLETTVDPQGIVAQEALF